MLTKHNLGQELQFKLPTVRYASTLNRRQRSEHEVRVWVNEDYNDGCGLASMLTLQLSTFTNPPATVVEAIGVRGMSQACCSDACARYVPRHGSLQAVGPSAKS